jgi:hypothetical protein
MQGFSTLARRGSWRVVLLLGCSPAVLGQVPEPEARLGFRPGADYRLATWEQVRAYCRDVDEASDRVLVRTLGETTEGRPYLVAFVSSPGTIADLERHRQTQAIIADPRRLQAASPPVDPAQSKVVVLITCSIHSSETASTLMALELLHELATGEDPATSEILDNTILLLVPSANPDGVDKVAQWYERSRGQPWEGAGMPWLYHKYAGHDTNRDWFMLNLKETRLLTRLLYHEWFPTITYDVHQMGSRGARLFVPPFHDPINPNLDPRLHQSIALIGAHMAADLAAAGKRGVLTHALYDNWWNGGNRTTPQRHNMIGVLTEAASVRMATPLFLSQDELQGEGRGFPDHKTATNFVDPWPGGWWRLRDIVDYERICARSLLTLAARYRPAFQQQYLAMGRDAIERGKTEPPFAWIVPADQEDPGRAARMVQILRDTGIEGQLAPSPFQAAGVTYPAGSWVLPASQPYRAHLKDMMERQVYPARFTSGGAAEPPYDVAGWTLPLQMGVRAVAVEEPFALEPATPPRPEDRPEPPSRDESADYLVLENRSNDDFPRLLKLAGDPDVRLIAGTVFSDGRELPRGGLLVPRQARSREVLTRQIAREPTARITPYHGSLAFRSTPALYRLEAPRIGLYQPWVPSMDEGWTRFVLESFAFPYTTLHNADIRAGNLRTRFDVVLIPSVSARTLREGFGPNETEPAYVGGLGPEGSQALRAFVREGGTLVCLEDSCHYAIAEWGLPVKEVLGGLRSSEFYCPGSILRVRAEALPAGSEAGLLTLGMPPEWSVYFDRSLAFEVDRGGPASIVAAYAPTRPLESGWLLGAEKLQGRAALVEVPLEAGRVVLFGFPPQHRGQTHGTFRLLFNALLRGSMTADE